MTPLVTIVIPTFGPPIFLEDAIKSVLTQTYRNLELIIVDDNGEGSEFQVESEIIVDRLTGGEVPIKLIKHTVNRNGAAARNTGIRESKGCYIGFLDADDRYDSERIAMLVAALESECDDFAAAYSSCEFYRHNKYVGRYDCPGTGNFLLETLACTFRFSSGSNIFIKRDALLLLSGFDEGFSRHQDYEFLVRYFLKFSILGVSEVLVTKNDEQNNLPKIGKMRKIKYQYVNKYRSLIRRQGFFIALRIVMAHVWSLMKQALKRLDFVYVVLVFGDILGLMLSVYSDKVERHS